ncbi:MAG: FecR domain-containing protein [Lachnospiraceae bacterium]|nr:FecR domain-containing protein [Lachnospiraceae bacterium]
MKKFLKSTKGKIIAGVAGTGCVAIGIAAAVLMQGDGYRTILVEECNGTSKVVTQKQEELDAYQGMHFYSGYDVSVLEDSDLTMHMDMDKYVYAEENTHFWLEASGTSEDSKTTIHLDSGSELNRIDKQLAEGEVYEVDTPNSTMSVRGTVFRVSVYTDENGDTYTSLEVLEGEVDVRLKTEDGTYNGEEASVATGEAVLIRSDDKISEFVKKEDTIIRAIDYTSLPKKTAEVLISYIEDGKKLCITAEELSEITGALSDSANATEEEHDIQERIVKEATCSEEGSIENYCTICGQVMETESVPKLDHVAGEWSEVKKAGCVSQGEEQQLCSICGMVLDTRSIAAAGHKYAEQTEAVTEKCTTTTTVKNVCSVCGNEIVVSVAQTVAHGATVTETLINPNCESIGISHNVCSVCGMEFSRDSIAAAGHQYGGWTTVSAGDCTHAGIQSRECEICGHEESQETGTGGHSYVTTHGVELLETQDGFQVEVTNVCSICGDTTTGTHTIQRDNKGILCTVCKTYLYQ